MDLVFWMGFYYQLALHVMERCGFAQRVFVYISMAYRTAPRFRWLFRGDPNPAATTSGLSWPEVTIQQPTLTIQKLAPANPLVVGQDPESEERIAGDGDPPACNLCLA